MIATRLLMGGGGAFVQPLPTGVLTYGTPYDITNDAKANGLPLAVPLSNGDWLLIYVKADTFESTKANIVGKLSSDEGPTWGSEFTIRSEASLSAFNPGICVLASGRVVIEYNLYDHVAHTTAADAVRVIYSDNPTAGASATWSSPYTVNAAFTGYCASGTSRLLVLPDQTIILPVYGDSGGNSSSQIFFSTDGGETFAGAVTTADGPADGRHYYEPSYARLANGTILGQYRTTSAAGNVYQNQSTDNGATWSATASVIPAYSPTNVIQRSNGTLVAACRANAASDPTAFTSIDSGASWVDQGAIESVFQTVYASWMDRTDGTGLIIYGKQPTASDSDIDIRAVPVTEALA